MKDIKILLVDDEKNFLIPVAERLGMRGAESRKAYDGVEALAAIKEEEPDVVVLDLKMPNMSGQEVAKHIHENYPKIKVIILTGHGTDKEETYLRELGIFDYLEKPVGLDKLADRIKDAYRSGLDAFEDDMAAAALAEGGVSVKDIKNIFKKK